MRYVERRSSSVGFVSVSGHSHGGKNGFLPVWVVSSLISKSPLSPLSVLLAPDKKQNEK